jgi:hypothetical protein
MGRHTVPRSRRRAASVAALALDLNRSLLEAPMARFSLVVAITAPLALAAAAHAGVGIIGYGVNGQGELFSFDVNNPSAPVQNIGNLGFVPEGIDFRPGTNTLYAIDVGPNVTQLYTVNINTGAATPVGEGFNSNGTNYSLTGSQRFGFDFNPTTLQGDNSMRIRLVSSGGANLRLNDTTGLVAGVDTDLNFAQVPTAGPAVYAAAYTNTFNATSGGATDLLVIDSTTRSLYRQNPPAAGTLNLVGSFGPNFLPFIDAQFDIFTTPNASVNFGYALFQFQTFRGLNPWVLHSINLSTGEATELGFVGGDFLNSAEFEGGFALLIPSPGAAGLLAAGGLLALRRRR